MSPLGASLPARVLGGLPVARRAARAVSDWLDLQWSLTIEGLEGVAHHARGRLLDVGCGDKPYEAIFRPHVSEYVGVEHEATFEATSAGKHKTKADVLYDGVRLPFEDQSFDTVLSVQVLEHTPEPQRLLNEMARVLRQDGTLIVSAPFSFRLHEEPYDFFRYTPHGLRSMCDAAGLEVFEIQAQGGFGAVIGHKLNSMLAFRVGRVQGLAQSLGKLGHENATREPTRMWTLPVVFPMMGAISLAARVFDRTMPDPTEALSFLVLARPKRPT